MTLVFNPALIGATNNAIRDAIDSAGTAGVLEIQNPLGVVLVRFVLGLPSFNDSVGGVSESTPIDPAQIIINGTATNFRVLNGVGAVVYSGEVPNDLTVDPNTVPISGEMGLTGLTLTEGTTTPYIYATSVPFGYHVNDSWTQDDVYGAGTNQTLLANRDPWTQTAPIVAGVNQISPVIVEHIVEDPDVWTQTAPAVGGVNDITSVVVPHEVGDPDAWTQTAPIVGGTNTILEVVVPHEVGDPDAWTQTAPIVGGTNTIG